MRPRVALRSQAKAEEGLSLMLQNLGGETHVYPRANFAGDIAGLRTRLNQHPNLVHQHVAFEGGNYFRYPTLLEFVAENPVRQGTLPDNIVRVAKVILDAGVEHSTKPVQFAAGLPALDWVPNCHSNPIAQRVRRKRQRRPPSLLIENASGVSSRLPENSLPEAFPIKASDNTVRMCRAQTTVRGKSAAR